jgi:hypothetical protein
MTPQEMFVARMRRHRERSRLSLAEIATETRIKRELLEAFEQNDLRGWPRGLYARAWVRAYASAIGFDPIDTVDEFCRLFPHGDRRAAATITEIAAIVASPSAYRDEFSHVEQDRRRTAGTRINVLRKPTARDQMVRVARTIRGLLVEIPFFHRAQYRERQ